MTLWIEQPCKNMPLNLTINLKIYTLSFIKLRVLCFIIKTDTNLQIKLKNLAILSGAFLCAKNHDCNYITF